MKSEKVLLGLGALITADTLYHGVNYCYNLLYKDNTYMEPHLKPLDKELFETYISNCKNYLEYGSGGSTYKASLNENIERIVSVESDLNWLHKVRNTVQKADIKFIDLKSKPNTWGRCGENVTDEVKKSYSNVIREIENPENLDLIMIDGRFRVASCLKCYELIDDNCCIIFDDFLNRPYYHIILSYFYVVDKTNDNHMVVLKKKPMLSKFKEIELDYLHRVINDYELDQR